MKHISKIIKRYKQENEKAYRQPNELDDLFKGFGSMYNDMYNNKSKDNDQNWMCIF